MLNILVSLSASVLAFFLLKTYRNVIRYSATKDLWRIGVAVTLKVFLETISVFLWRIDFTYEILDTLLLDLGLTFILLVFLRIAMGIVYDSIIVMNSTLAPRVLIYGTEEDAVALSVRLQNGSRFRVVGFLENKGEYGVYKIRDERIYRYTNHESLNRIIEETGTQKILFPNYSVVQKEKEDLIKYCQKAKIDLLIAPPLDEVKDDSQLRFRMRPMRIEDILGREEIAINMDAIRQSMRDKVILVTGAAGSIGSEFCRQIAPLGIHKLILFDSAETPMHLIRLELEKNFPFLQIEPIIGDVRNRMRLAKLFKTYKPNVVFHAAAYKHVPLMEENPCEALRVNVFGTRILADLSVEFGVEKFIFLSTDKAVNPTNVMGATKRLAEMYIQSLGTSISEGKIPGKTHFITTRFGNVVGSAGSVVLLFRKQIAEGGPLTVTDPEVTRFFMSIPEACRLIMEAATLSKGNEVMVFEMGQPVRIADVARRMIELSGYTPDEDIKIKYIGLRPGEKLFEEVFSIDENAMTTSHPKIYVAKVRQSDFFELSKNITKLSGLAFRCLVEDAVILLKELVPEYVSNHSVYCKFDKK